MKYPTRPNIAPKIPHKIRVFSTFQVRNKIPKLINLFYPNKERERSKEKELAPLLLSVTYAPLEQSGARTPRTQENTQSLWRKLNKLSVRSFQKMLILQGTLKERKERMRERARNIFDKILPLSRLAFVSSELVSLRLPALQTPPFQTLVSFGSSSPAQQVLIAGQVKLKTPEGVIFKGLVRRFVNVIDNSNYDIISLAYPQKLSSLLIHIQ